MASIINKFRNVTIKLHDLHLPIAVDYSQLRIVVLEAEDPIDSHFLEPLLRGSDLSGETRKQPQRTWQKLRSLQVNHNLCEVSTSYTDYAILVLINYQ